MRSRDGGTEHQQFGQRGERLEYASKQRRIAPRVDVLELNGADVGGDTMRALWDVRAPKS